MTNERILVSYCYHEKANTKRNLNFFIRHGLYDNIHLVINIKNEKTNLTKLPNKSNITKVLSKNEGWDFKGHLDNLTHMRSIMNIENTFDYVVLMNDSCIGPFFITGKWYVPFIKKLKNAEYVGIMRNQSWFNMCNISLLKKIEKIINTNATRTYNDAVKIEGILASSFKQDNITSIKHWSKPHSCFGAIFVKENRIGKNTGNGKGIYLSYISSFHLNACKFIMNIKSRIIIYALITFVIYTLIIEKKLI